MIVFLATGGPLSTHGRWIPAEQACLPIDDRGFLYGDGVFETARLHRGGYFRFSDHMARLARGAAALRIPVPEPGRLAAIAHDLARRNDLDEGVFRVTLSRGRDGRALAGPGANHPTVLATIRTLPADWRERAARGWVLITARTAHPPAEAWPAHVKGIGRLAGIFARLEAEAAGVDDALQLSPDGHIVEGPTWNVFWRRGDRLRTPAPELGILQGVTRAAILEIARDLGIPVEIGRWPRAELDAADEAFATMTSLGPVPIRRLDGRDFPVPAGDSMLKLLRDRYWELVEREARDDREREGARQDREAGAQQDREAGP